MKSWVVALLILNVTLLFGEPIASLFSDHKSFSVGDVITIIIDESTTASAEAKSETTKSFDHSISSTAGQGPFSFFPSSSLGATANNKAKGDASTSRGSTLASTMTARIASIDANGNLYIQGTRTVEINGEQEVTTLEGMVRPQDIQSDNSVQSSYIAEAKITYKGKGTVHEGAKIGLLSRVLNFLF